MSPTFSPLINYQLRIIFGQKIVSLTFFSQSSNNCQFRIPTQHFFSLQLYPYLLIFIQLNYSTNKDILVIETNFVIEINIINHFLKNHAQTLNNYNFETKGLFIYFKFCLKFLVKNNIFIKNILIGYY